MRAPNGDAAVDEGRRSRRHASILRSVGVGLAFAIVAVALFAGVGAADGDYEPDRFEPNDGFHEAETISEGSYDGLTLHDNDSDFYAVRLEEGEQLDARLAFSNADGDLTLLAFDADEKIVDMGISSSDDEMVTVVANRTETHYLGVFGDDSNVTNEYRLEVGDEAVSNDGFELHVDRFEPNDHLDQPSMISEGAYGDLTVRKGDNDLYVIDLEEGDRLETTIEFDHAEGDLNLAVFDPDIAEIDSSNSSSDGEELTLVAEQEGEHYISVTASDEVSNEYRLEANVDTDVDSGPDTSDDGTATDPDADRSESDDEETTSDSTDEDDVTGTDSEEDVADEEVVDEDGTESDAGGADDENDTDDEAAAEDDANGDDSDDGMPSNPALAIIAFVATALVIGRRT